MPFIVPGNYSKGELDRAGERIRSGCGVPSDMAILDNWRASHLYVLNTFQSTLRFRRSRSPNSDFITIAQRLKRRPTIIDKLGREQGMSLSRMHDIAGCRLIFPDVENLNKFRSGVLSTRASHELVGGKDRYDYICNPKSSGYRGIHDVYKYNVNSVGGVKWNGLRVEIQYRTVVQHAWATAVEISDIVNATRLKFSQASENIKRLFLICSEILTRVYEGRFGYCDKLSDREVFEEYNELENICHAVVRLRNLTSSEFQKFARTSKLFILVNYTSGDKGGRLEAEGFSDSATALSRYSEIESKLQAVADVVLVGSSQQDAIKLAYTNYFSDASGFITYLDKALSVIEGR